MYTESLVIVWFVKIAIKCMCDFKVTFGMLVIICICILCSIKLRILCNF